MTKLILAGAMAAVLVSPAVAQSYHAYAPGPYHGMLGAYGPVEGGTVMPDGAIARDPDPNIQFQLNREAEEGW
jgi:hypothetical protein